jgi:hypothetical protein
LISKADGLANQGLDMVEARFPCEPRSSSHCESDEKLIAYVIVSAAFKVNTHDILESAKQPANQGMAVAKGVYDGVSHLMTG